MNSGIVLAGTDGLTTMTVGHAHDACDRRDVADDIEIELFIQRRVDRVRRGHQEKCVAVRWGTHDRFGADIGAATWAVFYDELLAEPPESHGPMSRARMSGNPPGA